MNSRVELCIWGCRVVLVCTDPVQLPTVTTRVRDVLAEVDAAANRFRPDSALSRLNAAAGRGPVEISPLLAELVGVAIAVAADTDGLVDPTVGAALRALGYDQDFAALPQPTGVAEQRHRGTLARLRPTRGRWPQAPDWHAVALDRSSGRCALPAGTVLDLGATAKAWAADRAATAAAQAVTGGVLVALGGDVAVAGPAAVGGWPVRIADSAWADPGDSPGPVVTVAAGGLATSSTTQRRWVGPDGTVVHHLLDPRTGRPARSRWRTVSVAAANAVTANAASTGALVRGDGAARWLAERRLAARLVGHDDRVRTVGRWPAAPPLDQPAGPAGAVAAWSTRR